MNRQQETDKHARIAMIIISSIIIFLFVIALSGCHNNCTYEKVDWEDSDKWHEMWYTTIDTNSNGEADEIEEYHGKEGCSEYGEYVTDSTKVVLIISNGDTTRVIDPKPW